MSREVTTPEELDNLGFKATIVDANEHIWTNDGDSLDPWGSITAPESYGGPRWVNSHDIDLPALIIWEPAK